MSHQSRGEIHFVRDVRHPIYGEIKVFGDNDVVSREVAAGRAWEARVVGEMLQFVEPDTDFLDAGANLGMTTLGILAGGGRPRRVHCFEPRADAMALLQHNVMGRGDIRTYGFGLGDAHVARPYEKTLDNVGGTRLGLGHTHFCATMPLDELEYLFSDARVSVIKIDVETHELQLLRGSRRFIKSHRPVVFVEIFEDSVPAVSEELATLGYKLREQLDVWDFVFTPE